MIGEDVMVLSSEADLLRQLAGEMDCVSSASLSVIAYCSVVSTEPGQYTSIDDVPVKACGDGPPALDRFDAIAEDEATRSDPASRPAAATLPGALGPG